MMTYLSERTLDFDESSTGALTGRAHRRLTESTGSFF